MLAELDANGIAFIIGAIGIVVMQVVNAVLGYHREQAKIERDLRAEDALQEVATNVQTIEVATNSMKDALVESTRVSSEAIGVLRGRAEVTAEVAAETAAVVKSERDS